MNHATSNTERGIWAWDLVQLIVGISILGLVSILSINGLNEQSNRLIIQVTAKISFTLFALAFAASGIHLFFKKSITFWLLMNRKYLGIAFAIMHWIHLLALLALQYFFHPVFQKAATTSLMAGSLAYLFLTLMLLTSFPAFAKYISRKHWKQLHTIGGYWILFIFTTSYVRRWMTEWKWFPFVMAIGLVLVFRLWAFYYHRQKRSYA